MFGRLALARRYVLFATIMAASCSTPIVAVDENVIAEKFKFIRVGKTSREEILGRLGTLVHSYEGDRILTFSFQEDTNGRSHIVTRPLGDSGPTWRRDIHTVVLIFDAEGILEKHSLIRIR